MTPQETQYGTQLPENEAQSAHGCDQGQRRDDGGKGEREAGDTDTTLEPELIDPRGGCDDPPCSPKHP